MKTIKCIAALVAFALTLGACATDDKWGNAKIYLPQAVIVDGGITTEYPVPLNNNNVTKNYSIDPDGKLLVTLGVYRSGLQELLSYSVKVGADAVAAEKALTVSPSRVMLPDGYWTMPPQVTVPDGEREAIFFLEVDLPRLQQDFPDYYQNQLLLGVRISEPSRYELNEAICGAVVVIDGYTFFDRPANPPGPELVAGGALRDEDAALWNYADIQTSAGLMTIWGGRLTIDSSVISGDHLGEYWTELDEELTPGARYTFTMDVTTDGTASGAELNIGLAPEHSADGYRYPIKCALEGGGPGSENYYFASIHTWSDPFQLSSPFNGVLPRDAGYLYGFVNGSTEFVAGHGQKYLCIQVCCWGGTLGVITIENISIREVL